MTAAAAFLVGAALCLLPAGPEAAPAYSHKRLTSRVTQVYDGSSFQLERGLRSSLIGVRAPSLKAPGGRAAYELLRSLIEGKTVHLEVDEKLVDAYGQTQYYVFLEDGVFVNALVLLRGLGRAVLKHPNVRYRAKLIEAEKTAKAFRRGIWGDEFDPQSLERYRDVPPFWRR